MLVKRFLAFLISILLVLGGDCILLRAPTIQDPLSTTSQLPPPSSTSASTPLAMSMSIPSPTATLMPSPLATPTPPTGPDVIALPAGFLPSGMTNGQGSEFFVGSRGGGSQEGGQIYRGDFLTGEVELFMELAAGEMAAGLQFDPRTNYLFVSGADDVRVYDTTSGALVERYVVGQEQGLVSDLVVTAAGIYAADLFHPVLYHIPLAPDGTLLADANGETIALIDDDEVGFGYQFFPATAIAATADSQWLILANSTKGTLDRVAPSTGAVQGIGCIHVPAIDGLVLDGDILYVVISADIVATTQLDSNLTACELLVGLTTNDYAFNLPTAAVLFGDALYVVNGLPGSSRTAAPGTPGQDHAVILRVPRWP